MLVLFQNFPHKVSNKIGMGGVGFPIWYLFLTFDFLGDSKIQRLEKYLCLCIN